MKERDKVERKGISTKLAVSLSFYFFYFYILVSASFALVPSPLIFISFVEYDVADGWIENVDGPAWLYFVFVFFVPQSFGTVAHL